MLVGTATVTARGAPAVDPSTRSGDFYLATTGDLGLATSGDFLMARDMARSSRRRVDPLLRFPMIINIVGLRFANRVFEPVLNAEHVAKVRPPSAVARRRA